MKYLCIKTIKPFNDKFCNLQFRHWFVFKGTKLKSVIVNSDEMIITRFGNYICRVGSAEYEKHFIKIN